MVYALVIRTELIERRHHAAVVIQCVVLTKLTRRWFSYRATNACVWPHAVAMAVPWSVLCAAHPGSVVFGRRVYRPFEWQLLLVAAAARRECMH